MSDAHNTWTAEHFSTLGEGGRGEGGNLLPVDAPTKFCAATKID